MKLKGLIYVEKSDIMDNINYNYDDNYNDNSFDAEGYCESLKAEFAGKDSLEHLFASATAQMIALQRCPRDTDTVMLMLEHLVGILGLEIIDRLDRDDSTGYMLVVAVYLMIGYTAAAREPASEKYTIFETLTNKLIEDMNKRTEGGI